MKKGILFDLDGVLLDSMPYHVKAWQDIFKPYHVHIQQEDVYSREGTRTADLAKKLADLYDLNLSACNLPCRISISNEN